MRLVMCLFHFLNRLCYGVLLHPQQPMRTLALLGNTAQTVYFAAYYDNPIVSLPPVLAALLGATGLAFALEPRATGISCLWSFLYGFQYTYTWHNHCVFWVSCSVLFLPWVRLSEALNPLLGFELWPWCPEFVLIAWKAHLGFALLGYFMKHLSFCVWFVHTISKIFVHVV